MATPPDVISGEVIEVEWGNDIRDFACFGIDFGGAQETVEDASLTTTFETGATVTFTMPASWLGYKLMAWGTVGFTVNGNNARQVGARATIGGNNGAEAVAAGADITDTFDNVTVGVRHVVTGLSANATVNVQYRSNVAGGVSKANSSVNFIAMRTS